MFIVQATHADCGPESFYVEDETAVVAKVAQLLADDRDNALLVNVSVSHANFAVTATDMTDVDHYDVEYFATIDEANAWVQAQPESWFCTVEGLML